MIGGMRGYLLLVIPYPNVVAGRGEWIPGDMEPAVAGQELVGEVVGFKEVDEALELNRILGTDIGGLAEEMLGIADAPYHIIDSLVTEA